MVTRKSGRSGGLGADGGAGGSAGARPAGRRPPGAGGGRAGDAFSALVHVVWLVFAADDRIEPHEAGQLVRLVDELTAGDVPSEGIAELFNSYAELYSERGAEGSARVIAEALGEPRERRAAFRLAAFAALRGGRVGRGEAALLALLGAAFGFDERERGLLLDEAAGRVNEPG